MLSGMNHETLKMGKAVVQAPCQQLSWQLGYLKRSVLFLLPIVQDF
jgi:hypothetical protein